MPLLWCRMDHDWMDAPFLAPLSGEECHVVGRVWQIAARYGEPTWEPDPEHDGKLKPKHMRLPLAYLTPNYIAAQARVTVVVAQRVLELMRAVPEEGEPRIAVEVGRGTALVRNVAERNARAIEEAARKKRGPSTNDPQPGDGTRAPGARAARADGAETRAQDAPTPVPPRVEGRKEGRSSSTAERVGPEGSVVPHPPVEFAFQPGDLADISRAYDACTSIWPQPPNPDYARNAPLRKDIEGDWLLCKPASHVVAAMLAVDIALKATGGKFPDKPVWMLRKLVMDVPVGGNMALDTFFPGTRGAPAREAIGRHQARRRNGTNAAELIADAEARERPQEGST